ncbi:MAG: nuclear transport factor 2 family protein [Acidimicrobiia bacterium]|nr:MAG: nuclear transport factor 2 family protein [Acidimicrobiia bacterium]
MERQTTSELMRACYDAFARKDLDAIVALHHSDAIYHVAGTHPLAGDKVGIEAVLTYMLEVSQISGGRGGFVVEQVASDGDIAFSMAVGTAYHGDSPFSRPIVHLARFDAGRVAEFWDLPLDQRAEDEFWTGAVATTSPG